MNITPIHREAIHTEMRRKGIPQKAIAAELGYSKSAVSRLLSGKLKTINDDDALKLEKFLGVEFLRVSKGQKVSSLAIEIGELADQNEQFARVIAELIPLAQPPKGSPGWIETKDMTRVGQEIIRICFANEDKPGKVAREVLKLLSQ